MDLIIFSNLLLLLTELLLEITGAVRANPQRRPVRVETKEAWNPHLEAVHWCVTGRSEPELHQWPYNQFIPFIRRSIRPKRSFNHRQQLDFRAIYSASEDAIAAKAVILKFKSFARHDHNVGRRERWDPEPVEGIMIQANHNAFGFGLPTGAFSKVLADCTDVAGLDKWGGCIPCGKRAEVEAVPPSVFAYHYLDEEYFGERQDTILAHFEFVNPSCVQIRQLEFIVLTVRSFESFDYDLIRFGPYEVTEDVDHIRLTNSSFPSGPLECNAFTSPTIKVNPLKLFPPMAMSSLYVACLQEDLTLACEAPTKNPDICPNIPAPKCRAGDEDKEGPNPFFIQATCDAPCPDEDEFEEEDYDQNRLGEYRSPLVRVGFHILGCSLHGWIMIFANFFFFIISCAVARFGKETLNQYMLWGVKPWNWVHGASATIGALLVYFGLLSVDYSGLTSPYHRDFGIVYVVFLMITYVLAWIRHRNVWMDLGFEWSHAGFGYWAVFICAMVCVALAPTGMAVTAKVILGLVLLAFLIFSGYMTYRQVRLDKSMGMEPGRRIFPVIEGKFFELNIKVPEDKFRLTAFGVFTAIVLFLNIMAAVFPEHY